MVDLNDCDREPIHIPGTIQAFGVLLALDAEMKVTQISDNVHDHLSLGVGDVLGRSLSELVGRDACDEVRAVLREERWFDANPLRISASGKQFDGIVHRHDGVAILELEPNPNPESVDERSVHHPFRAALMRVQRATTVSELAEIITNEMRRTTRFERVMLYRFHEDGTGSVDAEAKAPELDAYLGLRYPASDIPAQARRLYLKSWLRLIFDADEKPARLVPPLRPDTGAPLDLSFSVLRSVSPVHIEYMKNMGVRASMSVSIVVRDRLWGLISCLNHTSARRVSQTTRSACEFLGRLASLQIAAFEDAALIDLRGRRRAVEEVLRHAMEAKEGDALVSILTEPRTLMDLVDAGGAAVVTDEIATCGRVPPPDVIRAIAKWLDDEGRQRPFATASLGSDFPPALVASDVASGILTFALPGARLMWFRPEIIETVNWGGDPTKAADASGKLRPRHSFALWKEQVRGWSRRWTASDLEAADELQRRATEVDLERRLRNERRAVRARDELLATVSHDLKNPLQIIHLQAENLLGKLVDDDPITHHVRGAVGRIARSSTRMKALIQDLVDLSRIESKALPLERRSVDVRALLEEAISDAQPLADAKRISLVADGVDAPPLDGDAHRLSQVLSNLLGNAIKFTDEGGTVTVRARPLEAELSVSVADTGRGIAPDDLPHVFERYWRPKHAHAEGTGLGLYIARAVVEAHGGRIEATSSPRGTTFTFTLPFRRRTPRS